MAFFGVTQLGYQDTIREHLENPGITPQYIYRSGKYRDPDAIKLPPIQNKQDLPQPSVVPVNQVSGYGPGPQGSLKEYTRLKHKHICNPTEPEDVWRVNILTSQGVANWKKDMPLLEKEPWTYVPRAVHVNSEMTRFVNQMSLTNREFSLF